MVDGLGGDDAVLGVDGGGLLGAVLVEDVDEDGGGAEVGGRAGEVAGVPGLDLGQAEDGVGLEDGERLTAVEVVVDHAGTVVPARKYLI